MGKKRVVAQFLHDREQAAARQVVTEIDDTTDSFIVGNVEESEIAGLRQKGVKVRVIEEGTPARTPGRDLGAPAATRGVNAAAPVPEGATQIDEARANFYLVQLRGPLAERMRQALSAAGAELLEYFPPRSYTSRLSPDQARAVQALPFVAGLRPYRAEDTGPIKIQPAEDTAAPGPVMRGAPARGPRAGFAPPEDASPADEDDAPDEPTQKQRVIADTRRGQSVAPTHDVRLHRSEDSDLVKAWLESHGAVVAYRRGRKIRAALPGNVLERQLAELPEVAQVCEYVPPELHNEIARQILGVDGAPGVGLVAAGIALTGAGEIIGVADTGIDMTHPDLQGQVLPDVACWGRPGNPGDYTDPIGHGTHVTGSIVGNGTASQGKIKGTAPGAKVFFQSLLDAKNKLGGLPADVRELLDQAYQKQARIHNNSWGANTASNYSIDDRDVDDFVWEHPDMLVVISAGNDGSAKKNRFSQAGWVDWQSIGSPASAKNALTVGASRSSRAAGAGGYTGLKYGQKWRTSFPKPPVSDELISGDPEQLAAFSSRGPSKDQRLKPDVVAPGTDIASARSSSATGDKFWGPYPGNNSYAFMGGTSMSAPLVAGCAALVREYYRSVRNHQPSAALVKATIINGARQLTGADAVANHPTLPNMHQGFGRVHMPWTIPSPAIPNLRLAFVDTWNDPGTGMEKTGALRKYQVAVTGGAWLRVCLTWTDPPGNSRQHDLTLAVEHLVSGQRTWGNDMGFHVSPWGEDDHDYENTVEIVRIDNPTPGDYMVAVIADNLYRLTPPHALQEFALVVTGDLGSALARMP